MLRGIHPAWALLLAALVASAVAAEDLARLRRKLAQERDADDRAKITAKIGKELLKQASNLYKQGAYTDAEDVLDLYIKAIRAAHDDLRQLKVDARRKPKGFKELEIHLRRSQRKLVDIHRRAPLENRSTVQEFITEVEAIRSELLRALLALDQKPEANDTEDGHRP
ncbi:MAG: hypothetical protein ACE5IP_05515 [Terriglobia bacterium]